MSILAVRGPMQRPTQERRVRGGFTLVEVMLVVAVISIVLVLAAPSFKGMIEAQRLRNINAQLVTDLQYARSEAVSRGTLLRLSFRSNASLTCYTLYTSPAGSTRCDCQLGAGSACSGAMVEVRTVQVPRNLGVKIEIPGTQARALAFDPVTGGLFTIPTDDFPAPMEDFVIDTSIDSARALRTRLNRSGRPTVCSPAGSTMGEPGC